jgi:hypothetical protein
MGGTYGEIDVLFERGVSAREFQSTKLDIFRPNRLVVTPSDGIEETMERQVLHEGKF